MERLKRSEVVDSAVAGQVVLAERVAKGPLAVQRAAVVVEMVSAVDYLVA